MGGVYAVAKPDPQLFIYPLSACFLGVVVWMIWSWSQLRHTLFEPYCLFLLAAVAFNGGQALLEVLNLNRNGLLDNAMPVETCLQALYLVVVGLASLHLGALLSIARSSWPIPRERIRAVADFRTARGARLVGYGLFAISIVPATAVIKENLTIAANFGYGGLFGHEAATGFGATVNVLYQFWMPAALFLLAGSRDSKTLASLAALAALLFAFANLAMGARGQAIMALIALAWIYDGTVSKLSRKLLLSGGLILLMLIPLIAATRDLRSGEHLAPSKLVEAFSLIDNPLVAATSEMGGTLLTVAHTIRLTPAVRDFDWGTSYLYALTTVVPNVGWDLHPAITHGLLGDWLVRTVEPETARLGGGLGYSFVAEAYINFGWIGAPIPLALIGFLIVRLSLWAEFPPDVLKRALVASFLAFFLWLARSETGTILRPLVWYATAPYVIARLCAGRRRRRWRPGLTVSAGKVGCAATTRGLQVLAGHNFPGPAIARRDPRVRPSLG
jgi:oligosaccharide repeat unit polymerase